MKISFLANSKLSPRQIGIISALIDERVSIILGQTIKKKIASLYFVESLENKVPLEYVNQKVGFYVSAEQNCDIQAHIYMHKSIFEELIIPGNGQFTFDTTVKAIAHRLI